MTWFYWALASAVFAGLTAVLAKAGVRQVDATLASALRCSVAVIFSWVLVWWSVPAGSWKNVGPRSLLFITLSGLATGASWLCYFRALQSGPVSRVAPIDKLSVVVAVLLSMLFFGEKLHSRDFIGVGLIAVGAVLMALR